MINELTKAFSEIDQLMLERQMEWAMGRMDALSEYTKNFDFQTMRRFTEGAIEISGGKTWYKVFYGSNKEAVSHIVETNVANMIQKRNDRIITALHKKGIYEIGDFEIKHVGDGYQGTFIIGDFLVSIHTIWAGGYDIQCLHQRTLIKVNSITKGAA